MLASRSATKGYRGLAMEGFVARRYARLRDTEAQAADRRRQAVELTQGLGDGARILEIAPGPGFLSIELARLGRYEVMGLDVSHTFVAMAQENADAAGVRATFVHGDVAYMDFDEASFDLVVCQAAFKNFSRPRRALLEIHRVLKDGGRAIIQDMRRDASNRAIDDEVRSMDLGWAASFFTRRVLAGLRRRAYTSDEFEQLAAESAFHGAELRSSGIAIDVRLKKRPAGTRPAPDLSEATSVPRDLGSGAWPSGTTVPGSTSSRPSASDWARTASDSEEARSASTW